MTKGAWCVFAWGLVNDKPAGRRCVQHRQLGAWPRNCTAGHAHPHAHARPPGTTHIQIPIRLTRPWAGALACNILNLRTQQASRPGVLYL